MGDQYEFENPGEAWIALVEACRIADIDNRKKAVTICLNEAKNSHWNVALWNSEQELIADAVDYTGGDDQSEHPGSDYVPASSTQSYEDIDEDEPAFQPPSKVHRALARTCVTARATGWCANCGKELKYCYCTIR